MEMCLGFAGPSMPGHSPFRSSQRNGTFQTLDIDHFFEGTNVGGASLVDINASGGILYNVTTYPLGREFKVICDGCGNVSIPENQYWASAINDRFEIAAFRLSDNAPVVFNDKGDVSVLPVPVEELSGEIFTQPHAREKQTEVKIKESKFALHATQTDFLGAILISN